MRLRVAQILFSLIVSGSILAHPGRVDSTGGHTDKSTNSYHCHNEPCFQIHKQTEEAFLEAQEEKREFVTLYNRKDWPHWIDEDQDCQDTRAEILIKYSQIEVKTKRNKGCSVTWGLWLDPYTGNTFEKASDLDIDHIVPLAHAHRHGGASWSREEKRAFANDFENLLPVDDAENQAKSAQGPHEWMPMNQEYWCQYLEKWLYIKQKYKLVIGVDEDRAIKEMRGDCD